MIHGRLPITIVGAAVMLASCASDGGAGPLFGTDASGSTVTTTATGDTLAPTALEPLPIQEGLGTFDNYVWHMAVTTVGPTAGESSGNIVEWTFNRDPKSRISRLTTTATGPDIEGVDESTTERYTVEGETCQWDGETWTHTVTTDQQQEVLDAVQRLFDIAIVPESPANVGSEAIAGIPATHYRFSVSGFGAESGALVTANQVDYWLADDTGAVLKYTAVLESWSGPTDDPASTVYRVEATAELISANVFVPVELSPDCLAVPPE
jgi:hypothetical protein